MFKMLRAVLLIALFILKGTIVLSRWIFRMAVRGVSKLRRKLFHEDLRHTLLAERQRRFHDTRMELVSVRRDAEVRRARASQRNARFFLIKGNLPAAVDWFKKQRTHLHAAMGYSRWLRDLEDAA